MGEPPTPPLPQEQLQLQLEAVRREMAGVMEEKRVLEAALLAEQETSSAQARQLRKLRDARQPVAHLLVDVDWWQQQGRETLAAFRAAMSDDHAFGYYIIAPRVWRMLR